MAAPYVKGERVEILVSRKHGWRSIGCCRVFDYDEDGYRVTLQIGKDRVCFRWNKGDCNWTPLPPYTSNGPVRIVTPDVDAPAEARKGSDQ